MNVPSVVCGELLIRLPQLLILAACVILVIRRRSWETVLALVGQLGGLAVNGFALFLTYSVIAERVSKDILNTYRPWTRTSSLLCAGMFAIGLLVSAIRIERVCRSSTSGS
jgi:hypothetical protein